MEAFALAFPHLRPQQTRQTNASFLTKARVRVPRRHAPSVAPRFVCVQQKDAPRPKSALSDMKRTLFTTLNGLNRGLNIDPDSDTITSEEDQVEEAIEALEDNYPPQLPTRDPRLPGRWRLIYTSSAITRYFGGVTGLQRLLPNAIVGEIMQLIDAEDGTSEFIEKVTFEMPLVGNQVTLDIRVQGTVRATNEERQIWEPQSVKCGAFSWFADNWKTFRAFQVADITYLDDDLRITRGQTGSVAVFQKTEQNDQ